eukprot:TRINITY_DN50484_c0_g1_i1.p1 TRINITY_DN50484_c0_g1~~TRINITY_DN50484_c0_g1_i1.p1  ORF type:complete len:699 (-),score=66.29 TRINITY_DN50484_c0_g1_i1:80-2008(-)
MRRTLTCIPDSRLAELFSGRWDAALPHDTDGRIFLDIDPVQFRLLLDWLSDVCRIGPSCNLPDLSDCAPADLAWSFKPLCALLRVSPSASRSCDSLDDDTQEMDTMNDLSGSLLDAANVQQVLRLISDGSPGHAVRLIYRASRDGFDASAFHSKCDGWSNTVVVAKSCGGYLFGGYSGSTPWSSNGNYVASEGSFLFRLAGPGSHGPSKHEVYQNHQHALYCTADAGPTFGGGYDLQFQNKGIVLMNLGHTYSNQTGSGSTFSSLAESMTVTVTDYEVFAVQAEHTPVLLLNELSMSFEEKPHVSEFIDSVCNLIVKTLARDRSNKRRRLEIQEKQRCLEKDVELLQAFIDIDDKKHEMVSLNVSGRIMTTTRSTLTQCAGSLLASKFGPQWSLQEDEVVDGGVFIDASPCDFAIVLNHLRLRRLFGSGEGLVLEPSAVPLGHKDSFGRLLSYLSLNDYITVRHVDSLLLSNDQLTSLKSLWQDFTGSKNLHLLHRATRDGFSAAAFHASCDGQAHTVVLAKSVGGYVFGAYSGSAAWSSADEYVSSDGAFLFCLHGPGISHPTKHPVQHNHQLSLYCSAGCGPTFGGGHDLSFQCGEADCVVSHIHFGHTYSNLTEVGVAISSLAESTRFRVTEWEVFVLR